MTLTELIQEVYTITGRPDQVDVTLSAIKSATLKAHHSDYYYKDMFETGVAFDTADYIQALDYRSVLPRYRALKYLRKYDITSGTPGKLLDILVPEQVMDDYKVQRGDVCYVAGAFIQINSRTAEQYYLWGTYINPDITTSGYDSWIAVDHPYAIIYEAAGTVFKAIGKDEEAATYKMLALENISLIKLSNVTAVGY